MKTHFILLRGLGREQGHWEDFGPKLEAMIPESKVYYADIPGNGAYFKKVTPLTISEIVDQTRKSLKKNSPEVFSADRPFTVFLGVSLGGMISVDWLSRHPHDANAGILISTSLGNSAPIYERLSLFGMKKMVQIFSAKSIEERQKRTLEMISSAPETHRDSLTVWTEINRERPVSPKNIVRQLIAAARYSSPKRKPQQPMLVLSSAGDRMVSPECSKAIATKWDLPHHIHPSAGHDLPLDDAQWVIEQSRNWLNQLAK